MQAVKSAVKSKLLNILEKQDSTSIDVLRKLLSNLNREVVSYNAEVDELNKLIQSVKGYDVSVTTASGQLAYLLLVQKRFGEFKSVCDDVRFPVR